MIITTLLAQIGNVLFWKRYKFGGTLLLIMGLYGGGFSIDNMRETFMIFCTLIGLIVILFRKYYIFAREVNVFSWVIFLFITTILLLTRSSHLLIIFVGWEGVGLISFVLIGWFMRREKAQSSAFHAFFYNRFADLFFMVLLFWELTSNQRLFVLHTGRKFTEGMTIGIFISVMLMLAIWMATAGKSAQFLFHPWLRRAIEGPTPVSSLLHRSTMVVAGVYLLLKLHPLLKCLCWDGLNTVLLFSATITIVFTSAWAISQNDLKKIIALSTTRQLRLMMVICCMGLYDLRFLHIVLHGFFKALLFLGSGVIIHNKCTHNQSLISLNLLPPSKRPFLYSVFCIGNVGLAGIPFLGSFSSKHQLLDLLQQAQSYSTLAFIALVLSPIMTVRYSWKLMAAIGQGTKITKSRSFYSSTSSAILPLTTLAAITIIFGNIFATGIVGGLSHLTSLEDLCSSSPLFITSLGYLLYLLSYQRGKSYLYNSRFSSVNWIFLLVRNFAEYCLYNLFEKMILKEGFKRLFINKESSSIRRNENYWEGSSRRFLITSLIYQERKLLRVSITLLLLISWSW